MNENNRNSVISLGGHSRYIIGNYTSNWDIHFPKLSQSGKWQIHLNITMLKIELYGQVKFKVLHESLK